MSDKLLIIGSYTSASDNEEAAIDREFYRQGYIVKDEVAFLNHPARVCYVPELSDTAYTRQDLLAMCNEQEDFARKCFYAIDWQHPETWIHEQFLHDEWGLCPRCRQIYDMEGERRSCPKCGFDPDQDTEIGKLLSGLSLLF